MVNTARVRWTKEAIQDVYDRLQDVIHEFNQTNCIYVKTRDASRKTITAEEKEELCNGCPFNRKVLDKNTLCEVVEDIFEYKKPH